MKNLKVLILSSVLLVFSFLFITDYLGQNTALTKVNAKEGKTIPTATKLTPQSPKDTYTTITISAAGDCTLGTDEKFRYEGSFIHEFRKNNNDYGFFFRNVKDIFEKDDLTIVNLETTLTTATKKKDKQFRFRGLPEFTKILKEGSIEAVSLANNHTHDYLQRGYDDTIKYLKADKIGYFGYEKKHITTIKGVKVGLLGYKGWNNSSSAKKQIKNDIQYLRDQGVQLVIVSYHWGEERKNYPNSTQKDLGRFTIDAGADLILGHHPHVIQGIEKYKGKYIVYSLANFSFGGNRNPSDKDTFIFQQSFQFKNNQLQKDTSINIIPASITSVKNRNNYQPTPLKGKDKQRVLDRIDKYSKDLNFSIKELTPK